MTQSEGSNRLNPWRLPEVLPPLQRRNKNPADESTCCYAQVHGVLLIKPQTCAPLVSLEHALHFVHLEPLYHGPKRQRLELLSFFPGRPERLPRLHLRREHVLR